MRFFLIFLSLCVSQTLYAQYYGSFLVNGDNDKFYPVTFVDQNWNSNKASVIEIGRSNVHQDDTWRGSLIARFSFHVTSWGHRSAFIDANIRNALMPNGFVGGWTDGTVSNGTYSIIIWLKGGGNTYYFTSPAVMSPVVYDNNLLPYQEPNGPLRSFKTVPDTYVNSFGFSSSGTAFYTGVDNNNYFAGNIGIGTPNCDAKLTVNGDVHARSIKVDVNIPVPDYVFDRDHKLPSLKATEDYIVRHHHLADVPSALKLNEEGIDVTKMNLILLKKVEELTLHLIIKDKEIKALRQEFTRSLANQHTRLVKLESFSKSRSHNK